MYDFYCLEDGAMFKMNHWKKHMYQYTLLETNIPLKIGHPKTTFHLPTIDFPGAMLDLGRLYTGRHEVIGKKSEDFLLDIVLQLKHEGLCGFGTTKYKYSNIFQPRKSLLSAFWATKHIALAFSYQLYIVTPWRIVFSGISTAFSPQKKEKLRRSARQAHRLIY